MTTTGPTAPSAPPARPSPTPAPAPIAIAEAARRFPGRRGYLNTATCGLPSTRSLAALASHLEEWRDGNCDPNGWDAPVRACRQMFAALAGVPVEWVAVGSQASVFAGMVAASVPEGATVLLPEGDFTSVLWPFLVEGERGVHARVVPLGELIGAVDDHTAWVAASLVQSADGTVIELAALRRAADRHGARLLLDATQAAGWLPLDGPACDVLIASGYKFLAGPRGTCYATIRPEVLPLLTPHTAGWYAGAEVSESYYGTPLRLSPDARRLDVSPAWPCWFGAEPALRLLLDVGIDAIHQHVTALAATLRARLNLPAPAGQAVIPSAIVSLPGDDQVLARLHAAGIKAAGRAGRVRLSFHLYNDEDDVERAAACFVP